MRRGASPRPIDDPKYFGGEVGWVRIVDVSASRKYLQTTSQYVSPLGESLSVRVDKGDLIMSIAGTVGRPIIIDIPACIHDGFVHLYDLQDVDNEYLYYCLKFIEPTIGRFGQSGTQTNLNSDIVRQIPIYLPDNYAEQSNIAKILSTVDAAIEQTEALIAKYSRIRTGLMQDLLTRGIDEQGRIRSEETHEFKDSTLGRIPVEWGVIKLGEACSKIQDGTHFSPKTEESGPFMYLTSKNIRFGHLDLRKCEYISEKSHDEIYKRCPVEYGDILLTKDGANTGNVAMNILQQPFSLLSSVAVLRGRKGYLENDYLLNSLLSEKMQRVIVDSMAGNAIPRITLHKIKNFEICVPKPSEQKRISESLKKYHKQLHDSKLGLMKLQTLKKALMQDLLSGPKPKEKSTTT